MLESKTVPGLRFAAERHGPHTSTEHNWQLVLENAEYTVEAGN